MGGQCGLYIIEEKNLVPALTALRLMVDPMLTVMSPQGNAAVKRHEMKPCE